MQNGRFPIALHILSLLAIQEEGIFVSSDFIAGSININSALVRKEIAQLKKHRLVLSREGKNGGVALGKDAGKISLSVIYLAIKDGDLLGRAKNKPNPKCPVGKQINKQLDILYTEVDDWLLKKLSRISLQKFAQQFT